MSLPFLLHISINNHRLPELLRAEHYESFSEDPAKPALIRAEPVQLIDIANEYWGA
jgi:hypothetical protein